MEAYRFISEALTMDRLSHAYIIQGYGEEPLRAALYAAKAFNCISEGEKPCGTCLACRKTDQHNHPDVYLISVPAQNIGIDLIRGLQKDIYIRPYEGEKKVYIIENGERMTVQAQNCLLKVLEDPPYTGAIVITSSNYNKLVPTVISRCQVLKLASCNQTQQLSSYMDMADCVVERDFVKASATIAQLVKEENKSAAGFVDYLLILFRDVLVFKTTADSSLLFFNGHRDTVESIASVVRYSDINKLIDMVSDATENIQYNANLQSIIEALLLDIQEVLLC